MTEDPRRPTRESLESERDLYLRLLNLGLQNEFEPFLREALEIVARLTGAHQGYIEIGGRSDGDASPGWWAAHGFSDAEIAAVRRLLSRGIIAEAMHEGETIVTRSALEDERFGRRDSVREAAVQAVICAPIGDPPLGVVYLQRRVEPGAFASEDQARVDTFARHVAPYADRLLVRRSASPRMDPTQEFRGRLRLEGLVGRSAAIAAVLREVALIAPLEVDVLLTGESGTGKSQIARVIHENSPRSTRPFVELNCAAIPESLIESELFGAVQGAHSTAVRRLDGKLTVAQGGTLLLDEVGELPVPAQAKLLQLLQSRVYYPLGSARPMRADLRVIAATNLDLERAVSDGRFRQDLFYRLNVLPIRMPSLAERRDDLVELANFFCETAIRRHRLPRVTLSDRLLDEVKVAEWPGNVRQLANAVEVAVIRAAGGGMMHVERAHLFPTLSADSDQAGTDDGGQSCGRRLTFQAATRGFQARLIRETLEQTGWSVADAARQLEVARSHLYALIRAFAIERREE